MSQAAGAWSYLVQRLRISGASLPKYVRGLERDNHVFTLHLYLGIHSEYV